LPDGRLLARPLRNGARWVKPVFATGLALGVLVVACMYNTNLIGKSPASCCPARKTRPAASAPGSNGDYG